MLRFVFIWCFVFTGLGAFAQTVDEKCLSDFVLAKQIQQRPEIAAEREVLEAFTERWIIERKERPTLREIITIPVVVHIVWRQPEENISDEQILSQIAVLNENFRFANTNKNDIPDEFSQLGVDVEIEFCLAARDPLGNPTSGITRTQTGIGNIGNDEASDGRYKIKHASLGGQNAWDTKRYLNIWVGKMSGGILGYACFPNTCTIQEDGIAVDPYAFGKGGITKSPNNLGQTTIHEAGHYLNLFHLWGSQQNSCSGTDYVNDTPEQFASSRGCPAHPKRTCASNDLFMNYMDYTDDKCVSMFTRGQKERMEATLMSVRKSLLDSNGCEAPVATRQPLLDGKVNTFPNPANEALSIDLQIPRKASVKLELIDFMGRIVYTDKVAAISRHSMILSNFPQGIYFLKVSADDAALTKRVLNVR